MIRSTRFSFVDALILLVLFFLWFAFAVVLSLVDWTSWYSGRRRLESMQACLRRASTASTVGIYEGVLVMKPIGLLREAAC